MTREVHSILGPLGIQASSSSMIAKDLQAAEGTDMSRSEGVELAAHHGQAKDKTDGGEGDQGVTTFLLRFGEGLGEYQLELI